MKEILPGVIIKKAPPRKLDKILYFREENFDLGELVIISINGEDFNKRFWYSSTGILRDALSRETITKEHIQRYLEMINS